MTLTLSAADLALVHSSARRYSYRWGLETEEIEQDAVVRLLRWPKEDLGDMRRPWIVQTVKQAAIKVCQARSRRKMPRFPLELDDPLTVVELPSGDIAQDHQVYFEELLRIAKKHLSAGQYAAVVATINGQDHLSASVRELLRQAHRRMKHWKDTGTWISSAQLKKAAA